MGRTNVVVNYTRHGLAAIDEQKRVGMLKLEQHYADSINPQGTTILLAPHLVVACAVVVSNLETRACACVRVRVRVRRTGA
jgi:hypothetical protein